MYCWNCGVKSPDNATFCTGCGASLAGQQAPAQQTHHKQDPIGLLVPINLSPLAVIAGYLGLFSVLLIPAPFALLAGILAYRDINNNPKYGGKFRAIFGIVMGTLGSLGLAMVLLSVLGESMGRQ